jgi:polygalacturonase
LELKVPQPKNLVSRRNLLGMISTASLGSGMLTAAAQSAEAKPPMADNANSYGARTYNIRDFGAKGDGKTLDTAALQAAIGACHRDQGGIVLVPAGIFVIGTVEMKSNVTLRVAADGKLLGSADGKQYHAAGAIPLTGDTTLDDGNVGLIFAVNGENITIEGPGTIDGQGAQFRSPRRGVSPPSGRGGEHRPYHLLLYRCKNLRVRDVFLLDSAYHSVRIIESQFVWCHGLHIYNRVNFNNDGFHFISSEYVHVSDCDVQSQDDACAMFGSCRNVTITNSTFSTRWAVFRLGGGNPENIAISNCVVHRTSGCPIKMQFDSVSRAQNILFSNLILQDVTGPISIDLDSRPLQSATPGEAREKGFVRNIMFNGIRARVVAKGLLFPDMPFEGHYNPGETRQCIVFNCVGDSFLEEISINDVHVSYGGGGTAAEAERTIPQIAGEYFEIGTPPAYGLYARRVRGLTVSNFRVSVEQPDLRPAIVLDQVSDVSVNGLVAQGDPQAKCVLRFVETSDVLVAAPRIVGKAAVFLEVQGAGSQGITVDGGDLSKAAAPLALAAGASKEAVRLRP